MQSDVEINSIQVAILRQLRRKDGLRFAEINVQKVSSDQFSYHLRQLIKVGLIEKSADNTYSLSALGKRRVTMLYPGESSFIEQGFLAVRIVLSKIENGHEYFLLQERNIVPYQGTYSTPGNKILFGEDVSNAAQRTMQLHTGLQCAVRLCGIAHFKEQHEGSVVQDKYFFVFAASSPEGALLPHDQGGSRNVWLTYEELESSGLSIPGGLEVLKMASADQLEFDERTFTIDTY